MATLSDEVVDENGYYASLYLHSLLSRGYDFLIVQSAGNGNKNHTSVDAIYNGLYASIDESNCVTSDKVSYNDIVNRIVIVGAAQNDGNNIYTQTYWSNAGDRVDICAPGKDIYSTIPGGLSGKYAYKEGTSMAAPIVTGVAALVWSINNELSGEEVKEIICDEQNTKYIVEDNTSDKHPLVNSYRMINANMAVEAAQNYDNAVEASMIPADVAVSVNWEMCYTDIEENGIVQQYAIITGVNEQNDILWRYETNKYEACELASVSSIGKFNENYYFVEDGSVIALNLLDGSVLWRNDDFGGSDINFDFGENGELYLCGYYGPDFFAVDKEGNTLVRIASFDPQYYWPYIVEYKGEAVRVSMGGTAGFDITVEVEVNLNDYSFEIMNNIESIAEGEAIELFGVLEKNGAGNFIVKLDSNLTFYNNINSYTVEEVGMTGVNSQYDLDNILGKKVCIRGTVMEAHTRYHYSQIMIVDGGTNLKVIN